jgi:CRP-like cAMP-binding protein
MAFKFQEGGTSKALFEELSKASLPLNVKKSEVLYHQGDEPRGIFIVTKGIVGLKHVTPSGREHLLRFFKCHHFFGHRSLLLQEPYHATAIALEPTEILFLPKHEATQLLERDPHLYKALAQVLAEELKRCELQRVLILENQILARTAQSIIYLKELYPNHNWTRQEIANFVASTPTTIIKALAELENRGLIAQVGRRIDIKDREGLLAIEESEVF